jgi:hypothetical protein
LAERHPARRMAGADSGLAAGGCTPVGGVGSRSCLSRVDCAGLAFCTAARA